MSGKRVPNMDARTNDRLRQVAQQRADITMQVARAARMTGILIGVSLCAFLTLLAVLVAAVLQ